MTPQPGPGRPAGARRVTGPNGYLTIQQSAIFSNTDEWYAAIPEESRPKKEQPFYHLLAENADSYYVAYVSEQNLVADNSGEPVDHPDLHDLFGDFEDGRYPLHFHLN